MMMNLIWFFFLVLLSWAGQSPAQDSPPPDIWPLQPGWAAEYRHSQMSFRMFAFYEGETELAGEPVFSVQLVWLGDFLRRYRYYFSWSPTRDLLFHGMECLEDAEASYWNPPVLYLDLPLEEGKEWESIVTLFTSQDRSGEGTPEHHRFSITAIPDVETPAGTFDCVHLDDHPLRGESMGGDWYSPGIGLVKMDFGNTGQLELVAWTLDGWESLPSVGETITLNFEWKPGMSMLVEKSSYKESMNGEQADTTMVSLSYRLEVGRLPSGMLIHTTDLVFDLPPVESGDEEEIELRDGLMRLANLSPNYIVDDEGNFEALAGAQALRDSILTVLRDLFSKNEEFDPVVWQSVENMISPETTEMFAAQEWTQLVGTWIGLEADIGYVYEYWDSAPSPVLPQIEVPMLVLVAATEKCPCEEGKYKNDCVKLVMTAHSDPEVSKQVMMSFFSQFPDSLEIPDFEPPTVRNSVALITDIKTMRPYSLETEQYVSVSFPNEQGQLQRGRQLKRESYQFFYDR